MKKLLLFCLLTLTNQIYFASEEPKIIDEFTLGEIKIISKVPSEMTSNNELYYKVIARNFIKSYGINTKKTGKIVIQEANNAVLLAPMWGIRNVIACDTEHHKLDLIYMRPIAKKNSAAK